MADPLVTLKLTDAEKNIPVIARLREAYYHQLAALRVKNDGHTNSESDTARLRGRIAEVKILLGLLTPEP